MKVIFNKFKLILLVFALLIIGCGNFVIRVRETSAATTLSGRILIQVQDKGQAWYVNPTNGQRYYLGRPEDAYAIMRALGLGVSNADINSFSYRAPARLAGRILLKVQDKGQAYYVDPVELKLYYLGRQTDAFNLMRSRGLGISNNDLIKIPVASAPAPVVSTKPAVIVSANADNKIFKFQFQTKNYEIIIPLSSSLYNSYKATPKLVTYQVGNEPENLREVFYGLFLKLKADDNSINTIVDKLKKVALDNSWSDDDLVEFIVSFVQYIPYDQSKVSAGGGSNSNPYYPYETLYLNKGVCSDKTFLAVLLLRKLGYGAAILDFPERNHTALGISCPVQYSVNSSGYCYGETTNYFPLGVIPQSLSNGQAQTADEFASAFNAGSMGKMEVYQATTGKIYQGMARLRAEVDNLRTTKLDLSSRQTEIDTLSASLVAKEAAVNSLREQMESYQSSGRISDYNNLVPQYNSLVNQYNAELAVYRSKIEEYNKKVLDFNAAVKAFYQQ